VVSPGPQVTRGGGLPNRPQPHQSARGGIPRTEPEFEPYVFIGTCIFNFKVILVLKETV